MPYINTDTDTDTDSHLAQYGAPPSLLPTSLLPPLAAQIAPQQGLQGLHGWQGLQGLSGCVGGDAYAEAGPECHVPKSYTLQPKH